MLIVTSLSAVSFNRSCTLSVYNYGVHHWLLIVCICTCIFRCVDVTKVGFGDVLVHVSNLKSLAGIRETVHQLLSQVYAYTVTYIHTVVSQHSIIIINTLNTYCIHESITFSVFNINFYHPVHEVRELGLPLSYTTVIYYISVVIYHAMFSL